MANKTSLITNVEKLDQELLRYINKIVNITSSASFSLLTIPIQHPFKDYTALLVCLVDCMKCTDCMDEDESKHASTEIVQECFR